MLNFDNAALVLGAVGMAEARGEELDRDALGRELELASAPLEDYLRHIDCLGLAWIPPQNESDLGPRLTPAGRQYLSLKGEVADDVLHFLPSVIEDLNTRRALIEAGGLLLDEFRYAVLADGGVEYARDLVPDAFASAVDKQLALNLLAAAVALMARLSCGDAAGCLAEEIIAVALLNEAEGWLEMQVEKGALERDDARAAAGRLNGIFELFEDDDVLDLFRMEEPADAAVAGHSWINQQAGVVDQRVEAWFQPFGGVTATGYLDERPS